MSEPTLRAPRAAGFWSSGHYQFLSEEWEIGLAWHVMIAPHDWARLYLRRRWSEVHPSRAFEISSVSSHAEPHEIDPPEVVWR